MFLKHDKVNIFSQCQKTQIHKHAYEENQSCINWAEYIVSFHCMCNLIIEHKKRKYKLKVVNNITFGSYSQLS